ncbi:PTS sugar transporter subunit IIB [Paucilactobacillus suebicus]|uniref:PTS system sorbose subfamily transporter subunit IIB n=1 Tax=Paucilactobacillus suebicus DSM 5007 = KCTC 3549 TaxID=1423807 RepID=A0A0R1VZP2_9LACO|nr:PTS sugar transporter subunit IIB [Paucilactobacillus suebicus]KRM10877.1 PTS system sorbose subfamily transporter subunit IIB [Paucilactobacillus suebicus DSM 5007 = KCTC 3549]
MGQINLARVDDRLIHGQVMTKWTKGKGTNTVYVVDNATAADDFMKDIYISTNSTGGLKIKVYSDQEVADEWKKDQFGSDKVVIIFKYIKEAKAAIDAGLELEELNVGGVSKKPNTEFVIPTVALGDDDKAILDELKGDGIKIYFQTVPDSKRVDY